MGDMHDVFCFSIAFVFLMKGVAGCSNLALLKPAKDSAAADPATGPEHAVDGATIFVMDVANNAFCSFVETHGVSGWWEVDLQVTVRVGSVRITTATYAYGRPKDFLLEVDPDPGCDATPRVCHQHSGTLPGGETVTIDCTAPVRGRTVRLTQVDPFFLCEFEVYQAEMEDEIDLNFRDLTVIKYPGRKKSFASSVETKTVSVIDCARECISHGMCSFFNFKKQGGESTCEISSSCVNSSDIIENIVEWDYYEEESCSP